MFKALAFIVTVAATATPATASTCRVAGLYKDLTANHSMRYEDVTEQATAASCVERAVAVRKGVEKTDRMLTCVVESPMPGGRIAGDVKAGGAGAGVAGRAGVCSLVVQRMDSMPHGGGVIRVIARRRTTTSLEGCLALAEYHFSSYRGHRTTTWLNYAGPEAKLDARYFKVSGRTGD